MLAQSLPGPDEAAQAQRSEAISLVSHSSLGFNSGSEPQKSCAGRGTS